MPLPEYPPIPGLVPKSAGIGLRIPERKADCSGLRPSWYPFQVNVCDVDAPDPEPLTDREMQVPTVPRPPWSEVFYDDFSTNRLAEYVIVGTAPTVVAGELVLPGAGSSNTRMTPTGSPRSHEMRATARINLGSSLTGSQLRMTVRIGTADGPGSNVAAGVHTELSPTTLSIVVGNAGVRASVPVSIVVNASYVVGVTIDAKNNVTAELFQADGVTPVAGSPLTWTLDAADGIITSAPGWGSFRLISTAQRARLDWFRVEATPA